MIEAGQIWRGKGAGNRYEIKVLRTPRRGKRIACERTAGGPVGNVIYVWPEQLTAAYELVEEKG